MYVPSYHYPIPSPQAYNVCIRRSTLYMYVYVDVYTCTCSIDHTCYLAVLTSLNMHGSLLYTLQVCYKCLSMYSGKYKVSEPIE